MFDPRHVSFMQKLVVRRTSVHISRHAFTLHIYLIYDSYDVQVPYSMIQYDDIKRCKTKTSSQIPNLMGAAGALGRAAA